MTQIAVDDPGWAASQPLEDKATVKRITPDSPLPQHKPNKLILQSLSIPPQLAVQSVASRRRFACIDIRFQVAAKVGITITRQEMGVTRQDSTESVRLMVLLEHNDQAFQWRTSQLLA